MLRLNIGAAGAAAGGSGGSGGSGPDGDYHSGAGGELELYLLLTALSGVEILGRVVGLEEAAELEVVQAVHVQGEGVLGTASLALE